MSIRELPYSTVFQLKAISPFAFLLTIRNPAGWWLLTPFEKFEDGVLWTGLRLSSGKIFGLKLRSDGTVKKPMVRCTVFSREELDTRERNELYETVGWMLGVEEDISEFFALAERDPLVQVLVEDLCGMRNPKRPDLFPSLTLAVTLQMAPIRRSYEMMNRLIKEYGTKLVFDGKEVWYWPSPERIAKAEVRELKERCNLGYRAKYLKSIAGVVCQGFPTLLDLEKLSSEEARAKLMGLEGIGEYSADIVSPHPGFPIDVWSVKIFNMLLFREEVESPRNNISKLKKIAEDRWGKWRGYVFTYVLNDLKNLSKRFNLNLTQF